jgi:hypothetical protein
LPVSKTAGNLATSHPGNGEGFDPFKTMFDLITGPSINAHAAPWQGASPVLGKGGWTGEVEDAIYASQGKGRSGGRGRNSGNGQRSAARPAVSQQAAAPMPAARPSAPAPTPAPQPAATSSKKAKRGSLLTAPRYAGEEPLGGNRTLLGS